jgi:hypothetical protein
METLTYTKVILIDNYLVYSPDFNIIIYKECKTSFTPFLTIKKHLLESHFSYYKN